MPERRLVRSEDIRPEKLIRARELRQEATRHENMLWEHLRRGAIGFHFRRQQVVEGFIVDFFSAYPRVVIEVDGPIHDEQPLEDARRDAVLVARGVLVVRFRNDEVEQDVEDVARRIAAACQERDRR